MCPAGAALATVSPHPEGQLFWYFAVQARKQEALSSWKTVSLGSLHAMYAYKTECVSETDCVDEQHPHTFKGAGVSGKAGLTPMEEMEMISTKYDYF